MSGVDLAQWLSAQLAEDERIARACPGGSEWYAGDIDCVADLSPEKCEHVAEHDPARVLREIDGRRRTLVRCQEEMLSGIPRLAHFAQQTLREMALGYSHRPGYKEATND